MSLRLRLTLLYTTLAGSVLLIFGTLVYGLVSIVLLDQVDNTLTQAATQIISKLSVNSFSQFDLRALSDYQPTENLVIQLWGNDRRLQLARPPGLTRSMDETSRSSSSPVFQSSRGAGISLRVLTIPLVSARGPVGVIQIGLSLTLIELIQQTLASVLILLMVLSMLLSGLAAWLATGRTLAPLATVTQVATQITRASDLSRRIPLTGNPDDEVGQLIQAFNHTLEQLEKQFTTQRRFLADVSHDLRTPLTVIKGNVGLIRKFKVVDEESLAGIEAEVDRLTRLVGDLLLLAQVESGRLPLEMAPVELDTVLLEVFQQMRLLVGERLQLKLAEIDQVQVLGDRDRLKQVFLNLVGNAIQYTQAGGQVNIALRKQGDQAQAIVSDNGPGISAEDLPHIFERFYRGEKSRRRSRNSGFGLGLSIVYYIVKSHGGTIDASSQEGVGTTFSVLLPLYRAEKPRLSEGGERQALVTSKEEKK
jgi:two-component system, OmpR family, sensor kinase